MKDIYEVNHSYSAGLVKQLTEDEVTSILLDNLCLLSGKEYIINIVEVIAESLRAVLWAMSVPSSKDYVDEKQGVFVTRLLNAVDELIPDLMTRFFNTIVSSNDNGKEAIKHILEEMETVGDIAKMPEGRRLPAPLHCIELAEIDYWLLVGGIPTCRLSKSVQEVCEHSGPVRVIKCPPTEVGLKIPIQSRDDWCNIPYEPLQKWAKRIFDNISMQPIPSGEFEYECYASGLEKFARSKDEFQYFRWTQKLDVLPDARYLLRLQGQYGPTRYAIGDIRNGKVIATGPLNPDHLDLRRLMYGIDAINNCPVFVKRKPLNNGAQLYTFRNKLPESEYRLFLALGRLHPNTNGKYYPRVWEVPFPHLSEVNDALSKLGLKITQ